MKSGFFILLLASLISKINGECANACNGHGKCTSYDMCICNRNWQANDCSERVCMYGLAHVDTPKGDLDMSGGISGPDHLVVDNHPTYPYGTTEQFPAMQDSDLTVLTDSAHYYMECSNKGTCSRDTGECQCFDGYDGVACQRASCPGYPNSCSGHGVCRSIRQLAEDDDQNVYKLWDKDSTMGCQCDPGYYGPDCSLRKCKYGVDPLYLDDSATVKYSVYDFATFTTAPTFAFSNGESESKPGYWAIRYYDNHGEDWVTSPIEAGSSCATVVAALEALPNNVIPSGSTYCTLTKAENVTQVYGFNWNYDAQHPASSSHPYRLAYKMAMWDSVTSYQSDEFGSDVPLKYFKSSFNETNNSQNKDNTTISGYVYRIKFFGNPGAFKQPEIEIYLDGKRPSLTTTPGEKVITKVWTDGQQGEYKDYFADHCDGVTVTIGVSGDKYFLNGFSLAEKNLLKACLGDADFESCNNVDVYNWDYGSKMYPHLIKLVRTVTTYTDGGYYAAIYYDPSDSTLDNLGSSSTGTFRLLNPFRPPDNFLTDTYEVYTTKGTFAMTSNKSEATFSFGSKYIYTVNASYDAVGASYDGDLSCEIGNSNSDKTKYISHCLNKTDIITFLSWDKPQYNPPHINLYTVKRLYTMPYSWSVKYRFPESGRKDSEMHYLTHVITTDISTNWGVSIVQSPHFNVYKFFPATTSTYEYVAECSNRGVCDSTSGVCKCFPGYTSDSCHEQSSLSL